MTSQPYPLFATRFKRLKAVCLSTKPRSGCQSDWEFKKGNQRNGQFEHLEPKFRRTQTSVKSASTIKHIENIRFPTQRDECINTAARYPQYRWLHNTVTLLDSRSRHVDCLVNSLLRLRSMSENTIYGHGAKLCSRV